MLATGTLVASLYLQPILIAGLLGGFLLVAIGTAPGTLPPRIVVLLIGSALLGYAFLGRAFAYLDLHSIYIGEIVLFSTAVISAVSGLFRGLFALRLVLLWAAFAGWCACRTIPYLEPYGILALRDAAIWGYGIFALITAGALEKFGFSSVLRWYGCILPGYLAWIIFARVLNVFWPHAQLLTGDAGVPLLAIKPGDAAVHLAGIAAFLTLRLHDHCGILRSRFRTAILWLLWSASTILVGSQNRGGLLALVSALLSLLVLAGPVRWARFSIGALAVILPLLALNPEIDIGTARKVSARQIVYNLSSVAGSDEPGYEGTRRWRLLWWQKIVNYTIQGPYFWTGKGFGVNLADDDGFQVTRNRSLRSPHNAHLNILARAGVPGLALWLLLQACFAVALLRLYRRIRASSHLYAPAVVAWIFAYWVAAFVNASFDVYLEGPQGGIWFWCLFGAGLAAARHFDSRAGYREQYGALHSSAAPEYT